MHANWSIFRFSVSRHTRIKDGTHKIDLTSLIRSSLTPFADIFIVEEQYSANKKRLRNSLFSLKNKVLRSSQEEKEESKILA